MVSFEGKKKTEYEKVGIPADMIKEVKRIIEEDKRLGFVSVQEFAKEAIRRSIIQYGGPLDKESGDK